MDSPTSLPVTLDEARALRAAGEWPTLLERTRALGDEAFREPELGFLLAVGYRRTGQTARALETLARVEPDVRRRGDRWVLGEVINLRGIALWESGRTAEAEACFEELLEAATGWGDEESVSRACNNLGVLAHVRGRRDLALTLYQRAQAAYQRLGNVRGLAETHHNIGITYRELGFDRDADAHFRRAIDLASAAGLQDVIALAETERAGLRVRWRDGRLAGEMARRALDRFRQIADPTGAANALRILGLAAHADGNLPEAEARLDEALGIARAHEDAMLRAEVQRDRATLLRETGRTAQAREAFDDAMAHFAQIGAAAEAEAVRTILLSLDEQSDSK